jgi:hypothetical protein
VIRRPSWERRSRGGSALSFMRHIVSCAADSLHPGGP